MIFCTCCVVHFAAAMQHASGGSFGCKTINVLTRCRCKPETERPGRDSADQSVPGLRPGVTRCTLSSGSRWCHCHPIISCSSKIQNALPFWCRLAHNVLEQRPLNGCSSNSSCIFYAVYGRRSSVRRIISALKSCLMKCVEAKLRKSSIESVAARLCDEALSSTSADKQVLGDITSPARVSAVLF